jgi:cell division protein FtsW
MKKETAKKKRVVKSTRADDSCSYDVKLMFPVLLLVGIGIVMVYSTSSALALKKFGSDYYFLKKQVLFSLLGIIALVACRHVPMKLVRSLTYPILIVAVLFLVAVKTTGFGYSANNATRWLRLGPVNFQPSELARMALIIYLAYSISKKGDKIKDFYVGFLPHFFVLCIFTVLIVLQPDFGSVIIFWSIAWIMLFVGGARFLHLLSPLMLFLPFCFFMISNSAYRLKRIISFLNPWQYSTDDGYQIIHSLMAFGTGGIWGEGIGKGYQKLFYLPEPHTDFIFSAIGEELGLFWVLIIIGLYFLILWVGISIARNAADSFESFIALGITCSISIQVCINMGVAVGLLPTKGLALPFLSYGGTSLLLSMASIGMLMNIGASSLRKT